MTPPLDEEEENEESRSLEAQARQTLETEGCPPCYPSDLEIPLRNVPENYRAIVEYWQSFAGTDDAVLCAELSDWWKFRAFQKRGRAQRRNKSSSKLVDEICKRRRRHGLDGDANLQPESNQQNRLENWVGFQNYHLKRLERFETKWNEVKKYLDSSRKKAEDTGAAEDAEAIQQELENAKRDMERQKVLLHWIEQQRWAIVTEHSTSVEEDFGGQVAVSKATRRASARQCRTSRLQASAVLGKVKVSKTTLRKQNTHAQRPKAAESEIPVQDFGTILQSSILHTPRCQKATPQQVEESTPLRQFGPRRQSKAELFAVASTKPVSWQQPSGGSRAQSLEQAQSQRLPVPLRPKPSPKRVSTRSGRVSIPPARWAPF
jgi:hypothetical protein